MCELGDFEPCKIWRESNHKARKPHECSSCFRTIAAGETYLRHFSVFEGIACSECLCAECETDRDEFARSHNGTPQPDWFPHMLRKCIAEGDEESERQWRPILERIRGRQQATKPATEERS